MGRLQSCRPFSCRVQERISQHRPCDIGLGRLSGSTQLQAACDLRPLGHLSHAELIWAASASEPGHAVLAVAGPVSVPQEGHCVLHLRPVGGVGWQLLLD